jgi:succinyl-CoA synthetase beta subunit
MRCRSGCSHSFILLTPSQVIAEGIIKATKELQLTIPLIVRLQGTKEAEAKKMITESGLKIYPFGEFARLPSRWDEC